MLYNANVQRKFHPYCHITDDQKEHLPALPIQLKPGLHKTACQHLNGDKQYLCPLDLQKILAQRPLQLS